MSKPVTLSILFLVLRPTEPKIVYYCHNILELFRLREVFGTHNHRVYRYTELLKNSNKKFDLYAVFTTELTWEVGTANSGVGFEQISYEQLEANWEFIKCIQK
jgi:hypothetical protein